MNATEAYCERSNYLNDSRVRAAEAGNWYVSLNPHLMQAVVVTHDDEGEKTESWIGFKYEVCDLCGGRGTHVNPSIDAGGHTPDPGDCDEYGDSHYHAGRYDVTCYRCKGDRVAPTPDPKGNHERDLLAKLEKEWAADAAYAAECRAERMMGC